MRPLVRIAAAAAVLAAGCSTAAAAVPVVPAGDYLVSDATGRLLVVVPVGRVFGTAASAPHATGLALGADRRTVYVSTSRGVVLPPALAAIDLATGSQRMLASGLAPAVSPDGRRLAYVAAALSRGGGFSVVTGLAIRDLRTGATRLLPAPAGTLPHGPLNWSPDGRRIAVYDGAKIRLVDVATARDLASQPGVPGDEPNHPISARVYPPTTTPATQIPAPPPPTSATSLAPVFLDARTVVADYDCCIGESHLVAFDLATGRRSAFATLPAPPETIVRVAPGRLLVVTALHALVLVSRGHAQVFATGITAADG